MMPISNSVVTCRSRIEYIQIAKYLLHIFISVDFRNASQNWFDQKYIWFNNTFSISTQVLLLRSTLHLASIQQRRLKHIEWLEEHCLNRECLFKYQLIMLLLIIDAAKRFIFNYVFRCQIIRWKNKYRKFAFDKTTRLT